MSSGRLRCVLAFVLLEQLLYRRRVVVDHHFGVEHLFDHVTLGAEPVAHILADGDAGACDEAREPQQEDDQHGRASGLARSDEAHQYINEQYDGNQYNKYAENRYHSVMPSGKKGERMPPPPMTRRTAR